MATRPSSHSRLLAFFQAFRKRSGSNIRTSGPTSTEGCKLAGDTRTRDLGNEFEGMAVPNLQELAIPTTSMHAKAPRPDRHTRLKHQTTRSRTIWAKCR